METPSPHLLNSSEQRLTQAHLVESLRAAQMGIRVGLRKRPLKCHAGKVHRAKERRPPRSRSSRPPPNSWSRDHHMIPILIIITIIHLLSSSIIVGHHHLPSITRHRSSAFISHHPRPRPPPHHERHSHLSEATGHGDYIRISSSSSKEWCNQVFASNIR